MKGKITLVIALLLLSFLSYSISSTKKNPDINLPKPTPEYTTYKNIRYKKTDNLSLNLDIYQPKKLTREHLPVLIFLHGGGWTKGNKEVIHQNYREYILAELIKNQFCVISINYTLLDKKTHLEQPLQDIQDALRWVAKNADTYHLDINNVGIWGSSAGGHLALLTAYNQEKNAPFDLKYVIDFFGPTDLEKLFRTDASTVLLNLLKISSPDRYELRKAKIQELTGIDITKNKKAAQIKCAELSPIHYVNKTTIPTLIFHGKEDSIVDISQSMLLKNSLEQNKIYHQFHILEKAKHSFSNISQAEAYNIAKKTIDFAKSQTHY